MPALINKPHNINELMDRAQAIAGFNLQQIAALHQLSVPHDLRKEKGWIGQLLELHLGATAGSKPIQDFPELGVELKTIPINAQGKPLETTFVCVAPLTGNHGVTWSTCNVANKLKQVLWIPVLGERDIPIADRIVGSPLLWQPDTLENMQLQEDWEELMDMIALGQVEQITARHGKYLQLRPKAANNKVRTKAYGSEGEIIQVRPRGFYLKKAFTHQLLKKHFNI
ncbi:DNA mismatch repair endonuclease MutH [Moritella sp. JT01]|uniref:DNA mismatch repair endonuclease MutH n=1 Tax=Moritella sp. JT01 TaxID=756698 RepID=UPI0007944BBE|nr:DNA mismatch repair endonuclease MutH [Moritella sp. JT01]KXO13548.1 DNA mismatch repair endonuclease MutH [Moritella sp. JT01]